MLKMAIIFLVASLVEKKLMNHSAWKYENMLLLQVLNGNVHVKLKHDGFSRRTKHARKKARLRFLPHYNLRYMVEKLYRWLAWQTRRALTIYIGKHLQGESFSRGFTVQLQQKIYLSAKLNYYEKNVFYYFPLLFIS